MKTLVLVSTALALLAVVPVVAGIPVPNAVFTDAAGPAPATFSFTGDCNGAGTVTLDIYRPTGGVEQRTTDVSSWQTPDRCSWLACAACPRPFAWQLAKRGPPEEFVLLDGGGAAPGAWSLSGAFLGGVLTVADGPGN